MNLNSTSPKDLRNFGLIVGFIIGPIIGIGYPYFKHNEIYPIPTGIGAGLILLGILYPKSLTYLYLGWMKIGAVLGFINTRIILGTIFMLFFVPVGLIRKLLQKDSLSQSWTQNANTYWKESEIRENNHLERPF
jgi:hypothetical protein